MGVLQLPLDAVLGSSTKVKLLRALVPLSRPVALREAARLAEVSPGGAQGAMADLTALGILEREVVTAQHLYTINRCNRIVRMLQELFESEEYRWKELVEALERELREGLPGASVQAAAIFGSGARGDDRPDSDLDLLVVTTSDDRDEEVWERLLDAQPVFQRDFGVRISPVVMSVGRLRERAADGDPLIAAIVRDGITVVKPSIEELLP